MVQRIPMWCLWPLSGVCIVSAGVPVVWALALDGLTQPEATITTGVLAIAAAGVAFLGVHREVSSNERISRRNREAEAERAQRAELLEVVRDTITGMSQLTSSLIDPNNSRRAFVLNDVPTGWGGNARGAPDCIVGAVVRAGTSSVGHRVGRFARSRQRLL